jgi:hypothetical protein
MIGERRMSNGSNGSNGSNTSESLVARRVIGALACLVAALTTAPEASAQFTSAIDLSSRNAQPAADQWRSQLAVSPFARFDHPRLSVEGRWTALGGEGQRLNGFGNLGATYFSPTRSGLQLSVAGFADRSLLDETFAVSSLGADTRLSYRTGRSGAWLGREVMRDNRRTAVSPVPQASAGAWHQLGNAVVTFSLSTFSSREGARAARTWQEFRPVVKGPPIPGIPDTGRSIDTLTFGDSGSTGNQRNWNDAEVALHWNAGPLAFRGVVGSRFLTANQPNEMWGQVQGSYTLAPEVALIASSGVRPSSAAYGVPRGRFLEMGFRVAPSALRRPRLPAAIRPVAAAFTVEERATGHRTLRVRVPSARSVELSADFTGWKPISLVRADDDHWEATLPIAPGMHRVAIRVNGETWTPPPGVSAVPDEFQGTVGVIIIK